MIYTRLSGKRQGRLVDLFVAGTTARTTTELVGVNRNTARALYHRLRQLFASKLPSYDLSGEGQADQSYFGGMCAKANASGQRRARCPFWAC